MKAMRGFSLVELLITVFILAVLSAIAVPGFNTWITKLQTRSVAESALRGLQLARAEAIKRNAGTTIQFTGNTAWAITAWDSASNAMVAVQSSPAGEGAGRAVLNVTAPTAALPYNVSFDSLGRMTTPTSTLQLSAVPAGGNSCTASGPTNCLRVEVTPGGLVRMCDPAKTGTPQGC